MIDQASVSAGSILTIVIGASSLKIEQQGQLSFIYLGWIFLSVLIGAFFFGPVPRILRMVSSGSDKISLLGSLKRLNLLASVFIIFLVLLCYLLALGLEGLNECWLELLALVLFLFFFQHYEFDRRANYLFGSIAESGKASLGVLALRLMGFAVVSVDALIDVLFVLLVSVLLPGLRSFIDLRSLLCLGKPELPRRFMKYAKLSLLSSLVQMGHIHGPIIAIGLIGSLEAIAILVSLRSIANIFSPIVEIFDTALPSQFVLRDKTMGRSGRLQLFNIITGLSCIFCFIIFIFIWLLGDLLLGLALGSSYVDFRNELLILWSGNFFYILGRLLKVYMQIFEKFWQDFLASLVVNMLWIIWFFYQIESLSIASAALVIAIVQIMYVFAQIIFSFGSRAKSHC